MLSGNLFSKNQSPVPAIRISPTTAKVTKEIVCQISLKASPKPSLYNQKMSTAKTITPSTLLIIFLRYLPYIEQPLLFDVSIYLLLSVNYINLVGILNRPKGGFLVITADSPSNPHRSGISCLLKISGCTRLHRTYRYA